jgi:hypothetical protein
MRSRWFGSFAFCFSALFVSASAHAQQKFSFQYSAKVVCGTGKSNSEWDRTELMPFRTRVNIHNPENPPVTFTKQILVLTPDQTPTDPILLSTDTLKGKQALATDCADIRAKAEKAGKSIPGNRFEGFLVIETAPFLFDTLPDGTPLDVSVVYTTESKLMEGGDVEVIEVRERIIQAN